MRNGSTRSSGGERRYLLTVMPRGEKRYGLALLEEARPPRNGGVPKPLVKIWGDPLGVVMDQVLGVLKRSGYKVTDLSPGRKTPFQLEEEEAVRLGLLFLALKPMRKPSRMDTIARQIRSMETEEVYYWFSRVTQKNEGQRARRAFRLLLAEE